MPETIEELNALGAYVKVVERDIWETINNIHRHRGSEAANEWLDAYSDSGINTIKTAYNEGLRILLENAVRSVTKAIDVGKARGIGLDTEIRYILHEIGEQEGKKFDEWARKEEE